MSRKPQPTPEDRRILELMDKLSTVCDGYSNKVALSALLSLAGSIIGENNTTTAEAMTVAAISGLQMMDMIREVREKRQEAKP